jgi:predicted DNA-binding protein
MRINHRRQDEEGDLMEGKIRMHLTSINMTLKMINELDEIAGRFGVPKAVIVRNAVQVYLDSRKEKE